MKSVKLTRTGFQAEVTKNGTGNSQFFALRPSILGHNLVDICRISVELLSRVVFMCRCKIASVAKPTFQSPRKTVRLPFLPHPRRFVRLMRQERPAMNRDDPK